jgi:hypothetical protein
LLNGYRFHNVNDFAATAGAELHGSGLQRKQSVIATAPNVNAGVEVGTALADDDLASLDNLPTETLDTQHLGIGITAVPGGTSALLMCHLGSPSLQ